MNTLTETTSKRVNRWNYDYICPGPVGSIGDPVQDIRLYSSTPDDPIRWEYNAMELQRMGSAITDGSIMNPYSLGLGAPTVISDPYSNDITSWETGFRITDVRPNDLSAAVRERSDPQLSWRTLTSQSDWSGFAKYNGPLVASGPVSRGPEPTMSQGGGSVPVPIPAPTGGGGGGIGPAPSGNIGGGIGPASGGQCIRPY